MKIQTRKKICTRARPKSYFDLSWGGPQRLRAVAERRWKRDSALRWNQMIDRNKDADEAAKKAARDTAWRLRFEKSLSKYEKKLAEENAIEEGWHNFAYKEDGPTPDWVRSLGDEDPDPDSMMV